MVSLLFKQLVRSKVVTIVLGLLMLLGTISILTGHVFLKNQQKKIDQTIAYQQKHLDTQMQLHEEDLGLLLYYLKFSYIKSLSPLAGVSIGQSDLHSNIQHVTILNLEGQKYDTDLVNPVQQQVGNLDLAFTIIYLFPLVIVTLMFNLHSEEAESGIWNLIKIQGDSSFKFLFLKGTIRFTLVALALGILFLLAKVIHGIPFNLAFINVMLLSYTYILFWFGLSFAVILFRASSGTNAITLLSSWLILTIILPIVLNKYVHAQYPIEDAYSMAIKQRDGYHQKWDTDKGETMKKFYDHYPEFSKYGVIEEGFSWLWYYAMQQMGDDESLTERQAMYHNIKGRDQLSQKCASYIPALQVQLAMNDISQTSLSHQVDFWNATTKWHEDFRLRLYPSIFEEKHASEIDWTLFEPQYFDPESDFNISKPLLSILLITLLLLSISIFLNLKHL